MMNTITLNSLHNLWSTDRELQNNSFSSILEQTNQPVDWAYDVWDELLTNLNHKDNHNRAIATQVLCNLAKSDPENRMLKDFEKILAVTKDERFVTARHTLQALWKIGIAGKHQQKLLLEGLDRRFKECSVEKNCTLIRYDIIQSLRNVYTTSQEEIIRQKALELMGLEEDIKYRKKYASAWRNP